MAMQRNGRGRNRDRDASEGDFLASGVAEAAARPPIWVEGRQAPAFSPRAYAEAGMLMARAEADGALLWLSSECAALAGRLDRRDWSGLARRMGRLGGLVPEAAGQARLCDGIALRAQAAGRLLTGGDPSLPEPPPPLPTVAARPSAEPEPAPAVATTPAVATSPNVAATPAPASRFEASLPTDPDLAAIRALMAAEVPVERVRTAPPATARASRRPAPPPVTAADRLPQLEKAEPAPETARKLARKALLRGLADWLEIRLLAGAVLACATPVGYGRALYRHFEGVDLRDYVADCHHPRRNSRD